jgi:hypothetical protein
MKVLQFDPEGKSLFSISENEKNKTPEAGGRAKGDTHSIPENEDSSHWFEPKELPPEFPSVPTLPENMLMAPLRPWLVDIAERACIPLVFVAAPAIIGLGTVIGRKLGIRPGVFDDWTVIPNLWGGIVGRPGMMKSHAVSEALKPVSRLAAKASEKFTEEKAVCDALEIEHKLEIDAIKKKMAKAANLGNSTSDLKEILTEKIKQMNDEQTTERRYMTQDATVEKLGEILKENPQGLLVARDELSGWLQTMDKSGREGDREFYLEAWNGTGGYTFDRIGRGTIHIPAVCLSIVGGIQPGKLKAHILGAINENSTGDDGLLQRLQLLVWPDRPGDWKEIKRKPNTEARNQAYSIYEALDGIKVEAADNEEPNTVPYVHFSPEGQAVFDEWRNQLEIRLRSDEFNNTPAFESHIAKYRSLMPSLALIFHMVDVAYKGGDIGAVSDEAAILAAAWCEYLELHARKVYAAELEPENQTAYLLANKIKEGSIQNGYTIRDIHRKEWTGLSSPEQVKKGLTALEDCNWLRVVKQDTGGRPTEVIQLNPKLKWHEHHE